METKQWYLSKTIWGAVIMLLATVLKATGLVDLTATEQGQLVDQLYSLAFAGSELVGFALVIWGRISASKNLTVRKHIELPAIKKEG